MLANVGVGFIFAPYFALFRTGQLKHHGQTTSP